MTSEDISEHDDPYEILGVEKTASSAEIKRAYHKLALKNHPDKQTHDKENATQLFQQISFAYTILSDSQKRKLYDDTGSLDESDSPCSSSWMDYYKELYSTVITPEAIAQFEKQYKDSEEELQDLITVYKKHKGDIFKIIDDVILASLDDEVRFKEKLNIAIEAGLIKKYKKFTANNTKERNRRVKEAESEATEAEKLAQEMGLDKKIETEDELASLMRKNQSKRLASLMDSLEAKYAKPVKEKIKSSSKKRRV